MNSLHQAFARFESMVIPAEAGPTQRREMRIAFFAGASVAMSMVMFACRESDSEEETTTTLNSLFSECMTFEPGESAENPPAQAAASSAENHA